MLQSIKAALKEIDSSKLEETDSPVGNEDVVSAKTEEFLHGEGGVSGYVERNFEDTGFTNLPITNPSLIQDPTDAAVVTNIPDTEFLDATSELQRAQAAFENSINIVDKAKDNERGTILDLYDYDK
jgi:hypothetical protein